MIGHVYAKFMDEEEAADTRGTRHRDTRHHERHNKVMLTNLNVELPLGITDSNSRNSANRKLQLRDRMILIMKHLVRFFLERTRNKG
jgi:hypothetical protein